MKNKETQKLTELAIHNPANYPTTREAYEKMFEEWFDSEEGELVSAARTTGGYTFGDARRTYAKDGSSSTRRKVTNPDGSVYRSIMRDGCHSPVGGAAVGDNCGCAECEAYIQSQKQA